MEILRADTLPLRAGAYYVRIQAMARKHQISLEEEFDAHDTPDTKYILARDDYLPVATARLYPPDPASKAEIILGRVVVLGEYRRKGLGTRVMLAAEQWAKELGYAAAVVDARENKLAFYENLGYRPVAEEPVQSGTFTCVRMKKLL